jgi:hypothetical protein
MTGENLLEYGISVKNYNNISDRAKLTINFLSMIVFMHIQNITLSFDEFYFQGEYRRTYDILRGK